MGAETHLCIELTEFKLILLGMCPFRWPVTVLLISEVNPILSSSDAEVSLAFRLRKQRTEESNSNTKRSPQNVPKRIPFAESDRDEKKIEKEVVLSGAITSTDG